MARDGLPDDQVDHELVRQFLRYDEDTGQLIWLPRLVRAENRGNDLPWNIQRAEQLAMAYSWK
jgi:hypothetical protein